MPAPAPVNMEEKKDKKEEKKDEKKPEEKEVEMVSYTSVVFAFNKFE